MRSLIFRKAAALTGALVMLLLAFSAYCEEEIRITRTPCPAGCRVLAVRGKTELCVLGPEEALTDECVRQLFYAGDRGETRVLSHEGFVDAEKISNQLYGGLPGENGAWLEKDEFWGDKFQCWAASTSNMLVMSGWSLLSTENTRDEDELFSLFRASFLNEGGYQKDGIQWFFLGDTDGETYPLITGTPRVPGIDPEKYLCYGVMSADADDFLSALEAQEWICRLKNGAAVGINVDLDTIQYPLIGSEEQIYSSDGVGTCMIMAQNAEEYLYTYTEDGKIEVLPENAAGEYVIRGLLHRDEEDGCYYPVEEFMGSWCYMRETQVDPSLLDWNRGYHLNDVGNGAHALTVNGYILEDGHLKALFITDSDDDAAVWVLTEENCDPSARINCCTLFPVEERVLSGGNVTWALQGYCGGDALIASVTVLESK